MDVGRGAMTTTSELTPQIRSEEQRGEELERDRTDIISCSPARRRSPARGMVDPDHSERLQQARVLQRAGIDWLEAELPDELHHSRLPGGIVAGDQHDGLQIQ